MIGKAHCSICKKLTDHKVEDLNLIRCNTCKEIQVYRMIFIALKIEAILAITDCWQCGPETIHMVNGNYKPGSTYLYCCGCQRTSVNEKINLE